MTRPGFPASGRRLLWLAALAGLFFLPVECVWAQARALATLSESRVPLGESVEYRIEVSGARSASRPAQITAEGLNITPMGSSQQFTYQSGVGLVGTVTYTYLVETTRPGTFVIPEQQFAAGSEMVRTNPVTLTVVASGGGAGGTATKQADYFARLVIPKTTAYAGEAVPAEVRIYLDPRIRIQFDQTLQLKGEGFTAQKFTDISEEQATVDGKVYRVFLLKTSFVPLKPGPLDVGPFETTCAATLPRPRPRGFGNDPFSDPFFNDPFGGFGIQKRIELKTDTAKMEIKPLPPGAPASFGGAIGQFTFDAAADPKKLGVGDPLTMRLSVGGKGNFDRFDAPAPLDDKGWKTYPATGKYRPEDEVRTRGVKVFEQVLAPTEVKTATPAYEFSYFDPAAEQYKTLRAAPIPITVAGGVPPPTPTPATASPAATPAPTAAPSPTAVPTPAPVADILHIRTDHPGGGSFVPLAQQRWFWLAQGVPFLLLAGGLGWLGWQRRPAARAARLALEQSALLAELDRLVRDPGSEGKEFLEAAIALAQRRSGAGPNASALEVCARARLDGEDAALLQRLFEQRDALVFSGGIATDLTTEDRRAFRALLDRLGRPALQPV
ncbi:MAG: protein BatD [Verrucomicrobia bacterium]|nr:protein BatD [Verrucomicrobiota bacterium]